MIRFPVLAVFAAGSVFAAPILDGPVPDSVPRPPAEPAPETWRFKVDLSQPMTGDYDLRKLMAGRDPWLTNRISRCFFGPIKRAPYFRDELNDDIDYYPEPYVERLAREGVNGLWLTIEFSDFSREVTGDWPEGGLRRIEKLRQTVARCGKYGIKVWLFCIEPSEKDFRKDPLALKHPDWIGCTYDNLMGTMCASHPGVQKYIRETVRDIFTAVPGLGGIINISNGERVTSCLSIIDIKSHPCRTLCDRCRGLSWAEPLHRVERPMVEGMREAGSDANLISWIYRGAYPLLPEGVVEAARTQPDGVIQQNNFETGVFLQQEGYWHLGPDYWISCPGPSIAFSQVAKAARSSGRRISAKIQLSCSHEIATIPVLPVPGLLYRKFKGMHDLGVTDSMFCWYFGSAPGLMNRAAGLLAYEDFKDDEETFLKRLAASEWGEDADRMMKVWKACSDGFANYPLSNPLQYYGPYHQGVVWPLRPDIEMRPLGDSWVPGQPAGGDLVGECLKDFSLREALALAKRMCAMVDAVEKDIAYLERRYADNPERRREIGLVRALQCHFTAGRDFFEFYHARRDAITFSRAGDTAGALRAIARMKAAVANELPLTRRMKELCLDDSRLGFHSEAESYLYYPDYFDWRVPVLEEAAVRLEQIEAEVRAGRGYPLSPLEQAAPVFPAKLDGRGDLVLEGEVPGNEKVTLWVYDRCGTHWVRKYEVEPVNGHYRCVIPALDWDNDPRQMPGWVQVHQDCFYMGDKWQFPEHPRFQHRWTHGDLLGFYSARIEITGSEEK